MVVWSSGMTRGLLGRGVFKPTGEDNPPWPWSSDCPKLQDTPGILASRCCLQARLYLSQELRRVLLVFVTSGTSVVEQNRSGPRSAVIVNWDAVERILCIDWIRGGSLCVHIFFSACGITTVIFNMLMINALILTQQNCVRNTRNADPWVPPPSRTNAFVVVLGEKHEAILAAVVNCQWLGYKLGE